MNIIEQLHQNVTPKVLDLVKHYTGDNQNKTHLLTSIYGILGARLSDKATAERVETLLKTNPNALHNGAKVLDALLQDEKGNSQVALLTGELAKEHNLPQSTTDAILATAVPFVLTEVKSLAKESSVASYLQSKWSDFSHILPSWTHALLPAGLLAGFAGLASGASAKAGELASGLGDFAGKAAHEAGDLAGDVKDGAKAAGAAALGAAGAAAAGLGALAGKALSGAGKLAGDVKDGAGKALDKAENLTSKAAHEAGDLAGDVKDGAKAAGAAALGAAGAAAAGLGALAGKALSGAGKLAGDVKDGIKDGADKVVSTAENLTEKAADKVDTAKENIKETFTSHTDTDKEKSDDKSALGAVVAGAAGAAVAAGTLASQAAKNTAQEAKNLTEKAVDTAKDAGKKVEAAAEKTANEVKDGTKAAAAATVAVATTAAQNVGHTAKEAKDAAGAALHETAKQGGGFLKSLLPIIGLVILGAILFLMLRSCQTSKQPVAAPTAKPTAAATATPSATPAADLKAATLSFATDDKGNALYSCRSQAGSEGVFASIGKALSEVFGTTQKCDFEASKDFAEDLPALDHLPKLAALLKGVPNASVSIDGKTVRFNGTDEAVVSKLVNDAKGILPSDFVVEAEPKLNTTEAVASSIDTAKEAMQNLDAQNASAEQVVQALNMQIINFATSSNAIPEENKEILNLAAEKLTALPDAHLKITGHTDSQGNHAFNQKLSERRAAAVRDYLVSKGIKADRLEIFGASSDEPVASNATEQGRFQNRRIEFTLIEKDGTITSVGNAENSKTLKDSKAEEPAAQEDKAQETKAAE